MSGTNVNDKSKTSGRVPSRGSLIHNAVLGLISGTVTLWIGLDAETGREVAGFWLGLAMTLGLLGTAATGAIARNTVRAVARRKTLEETLEKAMQDSGYTAEDGRAWLEREPGSPFYKPGPY